MKLTGAQMQELVTLINDGITRAELNRIVRFRLNVDADDIVDNGVTKLDAVFQVLDWATRRRLAQELVEGVIKEFPHLAPPLRRIIDEAMRADVVTPAATDAADDPLSSYFHDDEPFVDRFDLTARLDELWRMGRSGVLVVRGERYSGRSHSWWRIANVAARTGITACRIDVSRDPGTWKVGMFVERLASKMQVDRQRLKDSLGQGATQSAALVNALIEHFHGWREGRWCLVLDGLDRPGVEPAIIQLVEDLIADVLGSSMPPLSVILLGYGEHTQQTFRARILTEQIRWLKHEDLFTWLDAVTRAVGKNSTEDDLKLAAANVFAGLTHPFDAQSMDEMRERVKIQARQLLSRV